MDFQISNQQQFDLRLQEFLDDLKARDYSETTVNGYKSFLKKAWAHITQAGDIYTRKTYHNPLGAEMERYLDLLEKAGRYVRGIRVLFRELEACMTISCVEEIVKKYLRIAKMENPTLFREKKYTPHSFRHSIAVHMLEAGIPLPVIKNFLGHSSIEVTMIYATVSDELKNKYLKENSLASALLGNRKKNENKHTYPGLEFLNKL